MTQDPANNLPGDTRPGEEISSLHTSELIALNQRLPLQLTDPQSESTTAMPDDSRSGRDVESSDTGEFQDTQPQTRRLEAQSSQTQSHAETEPSPALIA